MRMWERQFKRIGVWLMVLWMVSAIPLGVFYAAYWSRVEQLPQSVARYEQRHGGRWVTVNQVSPWVIKALVATEDRSFYTNWGISLSGIGRSVLVDLNTGQPTEGGSTLTQQLVRDALLSPVKEFRRKISEALLSVLVTALYSKRQILTCYLNEVYFGQGAYGIFAASQRYFATVPRALSVPQATLLAGLVQAPTALDPVLHYQAAKNRQWIVLQSMVADHMLSLQRARSIFRAPLDLRGGSS